MTFKVVMIIVFTFQFILHSTRPIITLYSSTLGASAFEIGILTAMYAFFPLFFAIQAGKIADHIGDRIPILFGMMAACFGLIFPFFIQDIWSLYVSQMIVGMAHIFIIISLQNVLGNAATKENRDHYFGVFSMVVAIAQFIGPIVGGYVAEYTSYTFVFLFAGLFGIIGILASFWIPVIKSTNNKSEQDSSSTGSIFALLKIPLLQKALGISALVVYSRDIFIAYFPLYATQLHIADSSIGWIIALQGLAMVPVRFYIAELSHWIGRTRLLLSSIMLAGVAYVLIPLTSNTYIFMLLAILMGAGLGCGQPLSMTTLYNASPKSKTGEVLGLRLATNRVSQITAPLLFGAIGGGFGLIVVFFVSGVFLIGGALLTYSQDEEQL